MRIKKIEIHFLKLLVSFRKLVETLQKTQRFASVNLIKLSKNNQDHQGKTILKFFVQINLQDVITSVIALP